MTGLAGRVDLVVIGASTGGPLALIEILPRLPKDLPAPILIVQHMPAGFTERLARGLSSRCDFEVHEARAGMLAEPGKAYVAPGNVYMTVIRGDRGLQLHLHQGPPVNSCRPSVDVMFRSAARATGRNTLALVLTGMGQDGVAGARAVRAAGGQVVVQDEATSVVWGMPGQVAAAGQADKVLPLGRIAAEVTARLRQGRVARLSPVGPARATERAVQLSRSESARRRRRRRSRESAGLSTGELDQIRDTVYRVSGVVLVPESMPLAMMRLTNLARQEGHSDAGALVRAMGSRSQDELVGRAVDAVLNTETYFFRDGHPFEALRADILPGLIAARRGRRSLHLWSAACSAGQEPYSLAMLIRHHFPELRGWDVQITASDVSASSLAKARAGRYTARECARGLPEHLRHKYFWPAGEGYEVVPELRRLVSFRSLNLTRHWPAMQPVDVLLLRNVLLYFDMKTRLGILRQARRVLRDDGALLLGATESTLAVDPAFAAVRSGRATWYALKRRAA